MKSIVVSNQRFILTGFILSLGLVVASCANSSTGNSWEKSLAPDPQLQDQGTVATPTPAPSASPTPQNSPSSQSVQLPSDFPAEIPAYPNAKLEAVEPSGDKENGAVKTRWGSADPSNAIQVFYQKAFEQKPWSLTRRPQEEGRGTFVATHENLQVTVSLQPSQKSGVATEFEIEYRTLKAEATPTPTSSPTPTPGTSPTSEPAPQPTPEDTTTIPEELRQYVMDVAKLGILTLSTNATEDKTTILPNPNQVITRRQYARWLVNANNQIYANRPAKQIRLGVSSDQPAFQDIPTSDPDFAEIQGLAESGFIKSPLTGDANAIKFRPDEPLTREQLLLWKVPLDLGKTPPTATVDLIKQRWGFQDVSKIDAQAFGAILADFDNGDLSNIRRVFGNTTLLQPKKSVTRAEAAGALWYFGFQGEGVSAADVGQSQSSN